MTRRDEVLTLLLRNPDGLTDAELARLTGAAHPAVNQVCRQLAAERLIRRDDIGRPIINYPLASGARPQDRPVVASPHHAEWFWEGNVQTAVVQHLVGLGATVHSVADTATKARGTDVVATLGGRRMHVEVKGWPSTSYADPRRADEIKRTQPTLQAKHWFADAVLTALRLQGRHHADQVVIAFPNFPRYRNLATDTVATLYLIGIEIWFIDESGVVSTHT